MKIKVLGSSAGGGFPQWNCNCRNCNGVRRSTLKATRRTQSSIAVSANGEDWLLVNASPDLLAHIAAHPELQPARRARDSGIAAVLVIDAQIDHVTGLLMLREHDTPLPLYTTDAVWQDLCSGFPVATILSHYCGVEHYRIALDGAPLAIDALNGVQIDALPLSSKAPPYSPHRHAPRHGDNIGLVITNRQTGKRVFYAPGLGAIEAHVLAAMGEADLLLVDGTLWTGDEMIRLGLSKKTAADMGHLQQSGPGGMIEVLDSLEAQNVRKVLIHINNTNPILVEDGPERRLLTEHGIEVAYDGMTFEI
ncbi:Coenzyme PQQ synthesis protein B [Paraburkholderia aspalathi]|uniref:Coenzyme PQQ synthesis protein B n=1 Tax=Paraburkholderia aspalathi TaxID=1324617 RepID=A0ABM8SGN5_9BURK|nr:pyrroloquinoline quinone biosynthesis protein PqqB [Paraburkholderia aspalathi]MBK3821618.1 pyrroloquinoline quinone biosynthesis protein PqqB [Paraburkholderia aspalathi]MBK3833495.1 pyrroloquinoline quinone biosynthesis protein PqqB [Paraburkholderia aspalathi]MBK3863218.1 pyrroloquinoline quinone biosynthesis protein PqqB [Paraburkholderia aspalathi]CAE6808045.1 Coenzyme PQQ synthesis protein B [Paraburkholderia aspalathi]